MPCYSAKPKPCPFCGGEPRVEETWVPGARIDGKPLPIISVEVRCVCRSEPEIGRLRSGAYAVGRDADSAIAAWNRRTDPAREALKGSK